MITSEQKRFDALYDQHVRALKLHGYSDSTIDPESVTSNLKPSRLWANLPIFKTQSVYLI